MFTNLEIQKRLKNVIFRTIEENTSTIMFPYECELIHMNEDIFEEGIPVEVKFKLIDSQTNIIQMISKSFTFPVIEEYKKILKEHPEPTYVLTLEQLKHLKEIATNTASQYF